MQVKKLDMEETILCKARDEFALHGYENASMRTIAKKANTSLGNIYHYYPNKKALLDCILKPKVYELCQFIREHSQEEIAMDDMETIEAYLDEVDFESPQMKVLFSKEFVIFMETKDKEYQELRDTHMLLFRKHVAKHMKFYDPNHHFVIIATNMMVDSIKHLIKCSTCTQDKQDDIKRIFMMLCRGVAINHIEVYNDKRE